MRARNVRTAAAVIAAFLLSAKSVSAEDTGAPQDGKPVIETIQGDRIVVVISPNGENRMGTAGTVIDFGDSIKTGPHASAKISYPDGSKLLIGRATTMAVLAKTGDTHRGEVLDGQVRGLIEKARIKKLGDSRPKFVFKTRSAVMGVRGTDFVFQASETGASELRTLEGLVEVGKDEPTVMEGRGKLVKPSQMVTADTAGMGKVTEFDSKAYMASLEESNPEFQSLIHGEEAASAPETTEKRFDLLNFQFGGILVGQGRWASRGQVFSGHVGWSPRIRLIGPLGIRGHVAAYPLLAKDDGSESRTFVAIEVGALVSAQILGPIMIEAGAGGNHWTGGHSDGLGPLVMANVVWRFQNLKWLDRVYAGASIMDVKTTGSTGDGNRGPDLMAGGIRMGFGTSF